MFANENVVEGSYTQTMEEKDTAEGDKKMDVKLAWKTAANIVSAAQRVNSTEASTY